MRLKLCIAVSSVVSTIMSGGSSAVITKVNKDIKIVMNPGGSNMIATYENDLEGRGGIVFDAGYERLLKSSAGMYDNNNYIANIANWLEEHNNSLNSGNILIYNTFNKSGLDNNAISEYAVVTMGQENSYEVMLTDRIKTPEITEALLENYSQLWVVFGESGSDCCFAESELEAISGFAESGSSMFIVAGIDEDSVSSNLTGANSMSSRFGVTFSGQVKNEDELRISTSAYFFDRISGLLGSIYRAMT